MAKPDSQDLSVDEVDMQHSELKIFNTQREEQLPLVNNPTINQQIRNRMLFRDAQGVNFGKIYAK